MCCGLNVLKGQNFDGDVTHDFLDLRQVKTVLTPGRATQHSRLLRLLIGSRGVGWGQLGFLTGVWFYKSMVCNKTEPHRH